MCKRTRTSPTTTGDIVSPRKVDHDVNVPFRIDSDDFTRLPTRRPDSV